MPIFKRDRQEFNENYLNTLVSDPDSGVSLQEYKYHLALHPAQLTDVGKSIKDELSRKTARYDETFKGILLGYQNIKLPSQLGIIGLDNMYIHLDFYANFFVFRPTIGMILRGKVTRTTQDHVGCLVYKKFNISLPKSNKEDDDWLGLQAKVNNEIEFKITFVDLDGRLPHIRGDIREIFDMDSVATPLIEGDPVSKQKSKKTHKKDDVNEEVQSAISQVLAESLSQKKPKKKSKKSLDADDMKREEPEDHSHSKKKHKKSFESMDQDETGQLSRKELKKLRKEKQLKLENEEVNLSESLHLKDEPGEDFMHETTPKEHEGQSHSKKKHKKSSMSMDQDEENNQLSKKELKKLRKEKQLKLENEELNLSSDSLHLKDEEPSEDFMDSSVTKCIDEVMQEEPEDHSQSKKKHKKSITIDQDNEDTAHLSKKERKKLKKQLKLENEQLNLSSESLHIKDEAEHETSNRQAADSEQETPKKKKQKKRSKSESIMDFSLDSLDLNTLFDGKSIDFDKSTEQSATNNYSQKKTKRKRSQSVSQDIYLDNVKLEMDSDLEQIIGERKKLKS